jgi:hypothetical protein
VQFAEKGFLLGVVVHLVTVGSVVIDGVRVNAETLQRFP